MRNDFTDLHNEFRDNLKQINQQQLDENFVQLEQQLDEINVRDAARNLGAGVSRGAGRMVDAAGRGIKSLPKGRIDLGKMLLNPGQYASDYDPEKMLKKGVSKLGYRLQSAISGTAAFIGNKIFGSKQRAYKKYLERTVKKDRKRLESQKKLMQKLRGLTPAKMTTLLGEAMVEYLVQKRYSVIIRLEKEDAEIDKRQQGQDSNQNNNTSSVGKEDESSSKQNNAPEAKRKIGFTASEEIESNSFQVLFDRLLFEEDPQDKPSKEGQRLPWTYRQEQDSNKTPRERGRELNSSISKEKTPQQRAFDFAKEAVSKNSNNLRSVIELYIAHEDKMRLTSESKKALLYHSMEFCVARVFEKLLKRDFFSFANPIIEYDPNLKSLYTQYNNDPTVFFPAWLVYIQDKLNPNYKNRAKTADEVKDERTSDIANQTVSREEEKNAKQTAEKKKEENEDLKEENKENDQDKNKENNQEEDQEESRLEFLRKRLTLPNMIAYATKLRNFRTISTFINYDNIVKDIDIQLQELKAKESDIGGNNAANFFMTPMKKINAKLSTLKNEIEVKNMRMNQMRKAFANWSDEDKKEHEKEFRSKYENLQAEKNKLIGIYDKIKQKKSEFLSGGDISQAELDDLENVKVG